MAEGVAETGQQAGRSTVYAALLLRVTERDSAALLALLTFSLLLWTLAYQVPFTLLLPIGGDSETHRRRDDAPFLVGFHAPEPEPAEEDTREWWMLSERLLNGYAYRWTEDEAAIHLPGIGGGQRVVSLYAGSGRSGNDPVKSTWQVGEAAAFSVTLPPAARVYHILTHTGADGSLTIHTRTEAYIPPGDPRMLGFVLHELRVEPAAAGLRMPALAQLAWLAAALALLYGLLRWLVLDVRPALLLALACATLLALLLAWQRLALTLFAPTLAGLALACWGLALLAWLAAGGWQTRRYHWHAPRTTHSIPRLLSVQRQFGAIIALVLLAFALRAGGMLHPHAEFSDHFLHANNLLGVGLGSEVFFTEGLPDSRGGGDSPYPPGLYILLAPALTLVPPDMESRALIVQIGVALLDSLVLLLIWYLLRQAGSGQRAALFGAALYLLPPPMMASFSIGEYANLGGQVLALPAVALLALGNRSAARAPMLVTLFVILLSIGLLSHMGVAVSLAALMAAAWVLSVRCWLAHQTRPTSSQQAHALICSPWLLAAGGALAAVFVVVCYYTAPQFADIFSQRLAGESTAASAPAPSFLRQMGDIVRGLFAPWSRILPLTLAGGIIGLLLLWQRPHNTAKRRGLAATLLAWWLGVLLSFGLLLIASQGVRWQHFIYPALCLGGGVALATLWRRSNMGRVAAWLCLLTILSHGLLRWWIEQIYDYLH
jgi:hypothetical protein